jgi:hypothetical protein
MAVHDDSIHHNNKKTTNEKQGRKNKPNKRAAKAV